MISRLMRSSELQFEAALPPSRCEAGDVAERIAHLQKSIAHLTQELRETGDGS